MGDIGFDSVYLEYRNTIYDTESPRLMKAISYAVKEAHKENMKVAVNMLCHACCSRQTLGAEVSLYSLTPYQVWIKKGEFSFSTDQCENKWLVKQGGGPVDKAKRLRIIL